MNSTKGLTRIAAESDVESDNESENEIDITTVTKRRYNWKCIAMIVFVVSLIISAVLVVVVVIPYNDGDKMSDNEAVLAMDELMKLNVSYDNFTDDETLQYHQAFNVFDQDKDGYLNRSEFINYFQLQLNYSVFFQQIDVNGDNILSFSECVAYQHTINQIDEVHQSTVRMLGVHIQREYGFEYNLSSAPSAEEKALFIEYVALFLYFRQFDLDSNGYIRFDEYLSIGSENEFNARDINKNGKISLTELGNVMYGENNNSWKGISKQLFGENYKEIVIQLEEIEITAEMVQSINDELKLCPLSQLNQGYEKRRRLLSQVYGPKYYSCCRYYETCDWGCSFTNCGYHFNCRTQYLCNYENNGHAYYCRSGYRCWCNSGWDLQY